mmetsp:Transcript_173286/g.421506  ORF Transcript_173286/g.421506 Transcript_173286/m.421506 type:complete len:129 (+) Transcript_173286:81-467(+)
MAAAEAASGPLKAVFDTHFARFGAQNPAELATEYLATAQIKVHDNRTLKTDEYTGPDGAKTMFEGLFKRLSDTSDLAAPVVDIDEEGRTVFLVWKCPASGVVTATDTFVYNSDLMIVRQYIVVTTASD